LNDDDALVAAGPESAIAFRRDGIADAPVRSDAADLRHEHARLARHVRTHVPGVRDREEGAAGDLVDMLDSLVLGRTRRLDPRVVAALQFGAVRSARLPADCRVMFADPSGSALGDYLARHAIRFGTERVQFGGSMIDRAFLECEWVAMMMAHGAAAQFRP